VVEVKEFYKNYDLKSFVDENINEIEIVQIYTGIVRDPSFEMSVHYENIFYIMYIEKEKKII
jgi:hypothetical protein